MTVKLAGTEKGRRAYDWMCRSKPVGGFLRRPQATNEESTPRGDGAQMLRLTRNSLIPYSQEKLRVESSDRPYRKPTQVGRERIPRP